MSKNKHSKSKPNVLELVLGVIALTLAILYLWERFAPQVDIATPLPQQVETMVDTVLDNVGGGITVERATPVVAPTALPVAPPAPVNDTAYTSAVVAPATPVPTITPPVWLQKPNVVTILATAVPVPTLHFGTVEYTWVQPTATPATVTCADPNPPIVCLPKP